MNADSFKAILLEGGTDALWRTNPVFCIDELLVRWHEFEASGAIGPGGLGNLLAGLSQQGIRLPARALQRWAAGGHILAETTVTAAAQHPEPRIMGIATDVRAKSGRIYPLRPALATTGDWNIDSGLPFTPDEVQDCLAGLLKESGAPDPRGVPERFAFAFENTTGVKARGESMTVAAALAILDRLNRHASTLFRAAAAFVEIDAGGRLRAVSDIPVKLEAAHRECDELSLVICSPGAGNQYGQRTVVWEVQSLADLARHLFSAGLLTPLLDAVGPLTRPEAARVLDRIRCLVNREHRFGEAANLGHRVRKCGFLKPSDPTVSIEFARLHAAACRQHGEFEVAVAVSQEAHTQVAGLGELGCDDDEADAAAEYAASLFTGHRFRNIPPLLESWAAAAASCPRRFRSLTRIKIWNTLGRALAILNHEGWDELFARSLDLYRQLQDAENIDRTTHYRVHAWLRKGDVKKAREAMAGNSALRDGIGNGDHWAAFLQANLARLENRVWVDTILDERLAEGVKPYSAWRYVQATARQPRRGVDDTQSRLKRASELLRHEAFNVETNVCILFATFLDLNSAARSNDAESWTAAIKTAGSFLNLAPVHHEYYGPTVDALPRFPDLQAAETLLDLVPYF
jgi:hypothetical protein